MAKKIALMLAVIGLAFALTGCGLRSPDEMYALPKPTAEYESLQNSLDALQNQGYEFAAPLSGSNTQSVQMEDLDGDGVDEAIAFFRDSAGENHPMKICIFRADSEGGYALATTIEGDGDAINSVVYCQLNGTTTEEIVVGWRISGTVYALSAYSIEQDNVIELVTAPNYTRYIVRDLDQDNQSEIVLLQIATTEEGGNSATYYDWSNDTMMSINTTRLSATMTGVESMTFSYLEESYPALYVSGYHQDGLTTLVTDVLAVRQGLLTNISMNDTLGYSDTVHANLTAPKDINNDSVLELPMPVALPTSTSIENSDSFSLIQWIQFNLTGWKQPVGYTYHNLADGWYLEIPNEWYGQLILSREDTNLGATVERSILFYHQSSVTEAPQPFLAIYKNTGSNRVNRAESGDRFLLFADGEATYSAEFFDCDWNCGLTQQELAGSFHLILTNWSTD